MTPLIVFVILIALLFDFLNGFHDAANSIATVVTTRVLTPMRAVVWAAFFNFVAAFGFGTAVARTIGKGMIDVSVVDTYVILAGLVGAVVWDVLTWWWGLPTSSSHALIGGYAGAAVAKAGIGVLIAAGWLKTMMFIVLAPLIGLSLGYTLMIAVFWICRRSSPHRVDGVFRRLQLLSAAFYSLGHGTNDAQKTMGIITSLLFSAGLLKTFDVPWKVILMCHAVIALGTVFGGWRIVKTMGQRILTLLGTALWGIPVSTTHTITGAIMGVGATQRFSSVRWGVANRIIWAWIVTIPASALVSMVAYRLVTLGGS
jgi:inorganic phosphate transporter, PiT family